jgi:hypothetical protein
MQMHHSVYFMHVACLACTPVARHRGVSITLPSTEMVFLSTVLLCQ